MEVFEAVKKRRSIRRFQQRKVEEEKVEKVLEAARLAPSWGNVQPWRFIIVEEEERRKELAKIVRQRQIERAPLLIACCGDLHAWDEFPKRIEELNPGNPEAVEKVKNDPLINPKLVSKEMVLKRTNEQVIFAVQNMVLTATSLGLGSCIIGGRLPMDDVEKFLRLPEGMVVVCLLTLGYPDEQPEERPRLEMERLVRREVWE
jgi:nitroreductase